MNKLDFQKGNERSFFLLFIKFMEEEENKKEEIDFEINLKQ
jgi:hypothetical protein